MYHGEGIETWPGGESYHGSFVDDYKQGHGKFKYSDGGTYQGEFYEDLYEGKGINYDS